MTVRPDQVQPIADALRAHAPVVVVGAHGLGARATVRAALATLGELDIRELDGDGHAHGYLAGVEPLILALLDDAERHHPALVARHEQSLKRLWPRRDSPAFALARDLTSTSARDERTRFYHHEYQNKLLVGLAEFMFDALRLRAGRVMLVIDHADCLPPTSLSLLAIVRRLQPVSALLDVVLLDRRGTVRQDGGLRVVLAPLTMQQFEAATDLACLVPHQRELAYRQAGGNPAVCRVLATCLGDQFGKAATLPLAATIDLYLGALPLDRRHDLARAFADARCQGDPILQRNAETLPDVTMDDLHQARHDAALARYMDGAGPLVLVHALAIRDPLRRLQALVEPCDVLMGIGLYDTWFAFFAALFSSPALRRQGSGNDAINGLFVNAAFVLYAMGYTAAALAFLDDFLATYPDSRFVPTALYAQSMTYGRYQVPVNLPAAEDCAVRNLHIIDQQFADHPRHTYIKVFAENAYAYIKARQGKFEEALALCEQGIDDIVAAYGADQFQLHRSILIYNTSQVYELVGDLDHAEERLRAAIACDPLYAEYYNDLGNLLSRVTGREQEALAAYARAIALSPPYYEAHVNRGGLRAQLGDAAGARADFYRALAIKPTEWRALREAGNLSLLDGDAAAALLAYEQALHYETNDADLHANAGVAASCMGDRRRALRHYERALSIDPQHANARSNLAAEMTEGDRPDQRHQRHQLDQAGQHAARPRPGASPSRSQNS
ncbi:MAG: hypothetical protein ABW069_09885 [Duganella sp.]